ncbi:hypothetical protein CK203_077511 [Vitis vinifera]|uniref:Uncharacterized protein n=1 Tax=Vitis vinifera TaxID=29760 RepID=A0A438DT78_VITVI|nr:hypothetical protein CK203_077511 [Vitis vinifera]
MERNTRHDEEDDLKVDNGEVFEVEKKAFQVFKGGVGMVVGAFEESCGVGGFQGICYKEETLSLVVPEGVKGNGWEDFRKAISSVQDLSDQAVLCRCGCKEGPKNGALLPVGKWARAVICEREFNSERRVCFSEEMVAKRKYAEIHFRSEEGNEGGTGLSEACRLLKFQSSEKLKKRPSQAESTRSKDELMSAGGCVSQRPKNAAGLHAITRDNECYSWRPSSSFRSRSSIFKFGFQSAERRLGRESLRPIGGKLYRATNPNALFKARSIRAQFGVKSFGPPAGPAHETEARSSKGGPCSAFVLKAPMLRILRKGGNIDCSLSRVVKDKRSLNLCKAQSKKLASEPKGVAFCTETLANKVCLPLSVSSEQGHPLAGAFVPKSLPASFVSAIHSFRCQPFYSIPLESNFASQKPLTEILKTVLSLGNHLVAQRELCVSGRVLSPEPEPPTFLLEGFQIEGLTPTKMVKVQSVLESLRIRIVRDNGKGAAVESRSTLSADKVYFKRREKMIVEPRERLRASGGIVIMWDSNKFKCTEKVLRSFSIIVKLNSGGDFNVIRRISEKLGDSKLTFNMRCFHEFIRKSGLLDPPLRNAAFTWSNILQEALPRWTSDHSPICLETNPLKWGPTPFRFENMWLLHPEFKEKFSDWWQECTVEGWEGHKFMRKLKFVKSKLKDWNKVAFGDLRERKNFILSDLVYQECWDVIKEDLMRVFLKFHTNGIINQRCLCKVLHETISGSQGAFVEGRHILDAVLIANEVVDEKKRSREEGVVFKIDFEKAYDHVDWGFLDHVLERKGFSSKWRSWIRGCLSFIKFCNPS